MLPEPWDNKPNVRSIYHFPGGHVGFGESICFSELQTWNGLHTSQSGNLLYTIYMHRNKFWFLDFSGCINRFSYERSSKIIINWDRKCKCHSHRSHISSTLCFWANKNPEWQEGNWKWFKIIYIEPWSHIYSNKKGVCLFDCFFSLNIC